jgi:V8-like Glu-specific endopeptidase
MATHLFQSRLRNLSRLLVLGIGLAALSGPPAAAQSLSQDGGQSKVRSVSSPEFSRSLRKEWTREEMLKAIPYPMENLGQGRLAGPMALPSAEGPAAIVEPQLPKVGTLAPQGADPLRGGQGLAQYASGVLDPAYYGVFPLSTLGKVFFTDNGVNYVCSASVGGNNAVWTAGHCVFNPQTYTWHPNWVFVPGYRDGYAPNGYWYARELWTNTAWTDNPYNNFAYDFAMAVLWPDAYGNSVTARFGALGFMGNHDRNQFFTVLGYPAAYPYNGERMAYCQDPLITIDYSYNPQTNGIGCDHTGGTSGGSWIVQYTYNSYSGNYVNGVNSYKYGNDPYSIYAPYFGDAAINLYYQVIAR